MRVGGRVEWLLEPNHPDQFVAAWREVRERGVPLRILGGGSNVIVEDGLHRGVVLATERMTRIFRPESDGGGAALGGGDIFTPELPALQVKERDEDPRLIAWVGAGLPAVVRAARDLGWRGLEGLVGIPGQLGGALAMNAGGHWGDLWDVVERVRLLLPDGDLVDRDRSECHPSYRNGGLGEAIVLGAVLRLEPDDPERIRDRMRDHLLEKNAKQPVCERSSGCIFKNPDPETSGGRSAGALIEMSGGKGLRRGGAIVSPRHANFIVNGGGASAADLLGLIEEVERRVADRWGIELEREVKIWRVGGTDGSLRPV
jgi:UDP-N-acetylmuramate dehydrogenase